MFQDFSSRALLSSGLGEAFGGRLSGRRSVYIVHTCVHGRLLALHLEVEDALQVVDRYGFHVRDVGLLASALARLATALLGVEAYPQLPMKTAALWGRWRGFTR
jgi:hypothetical protein